jgi:hypothetical protein
MAHGRAETIVKALIDTTLVAINCGVAVIAVGYQAAAKAVFAPNASAATTTSTTPIGNHSFIRLIIVPSFGGCRSLARTDAVGRYGTFPGVGPASSKSFALDRVRNSITRPSGSVANTFRRMDRGTWRSKRFAYCRSNPALTICAHSG